MGNDIEEAGPGAGSTEGNKVKVGSHAVAFLTTAWRPELETVALTLNSAFQKLPRKGNMPIWPALEDRVIMCLLTEVKKKVASRCNIP